MIKLFETLSVNDIIIYIVLIFLAIKGIIDAIFWIKDKYNYKFNKDYKRKEQEEILAKYEENNKLMQEKMTKCHEVVKEKIDNLASSMNTRMDGMEEQLNILKTSDMHDAKGWIVEKHHILMRQGWVDDFTMDTIEKRYSDYKKEGGNSYVHSLMDEIRSLPKQPPQ